MKQLEREIESYLREQVGIMGGLFYKFVSPGNSGVPDRIAILPDGQVWFLELKMAGGKVRPLQVYQIRKLKEHGANVRIVQGKHEAVTWCKARWLELEAWHDETKV